MPTLRRIHVATPGNKRARNGTSLSLTDGDLAELASSYRPDLHQCKVAVDSVQTAIQLGAPAVLGHLDPRLVQAKGAMPAFGRVLAAEADTRGLWLDLELTEPMADYMQQGMYDHVSLSWYDRNDSRNPTPGKLHVRHLGFLGGEGSSMKDLQLPDTDLIEFSEGLDEHGCVYHVTELITYNEFAEASMDSVTTPETQTEEAPVVDEVVDTVQLLIEAMTGGDKGYKGEITGFLPEPTEDNSYLWNSDKQEFAGQFLDDSGNETETYDFSLALQDDGSMLRSYKRVLADAEAVPTESDVEAEALAADATTTEMSEGDGMSVDLADLPMPDAMPVLPQLSTISVDISEYEELKAKSLLYGAMLEEVAERGRQDQISALQLAIQPLYDMGLISSSVKSGDIAKALMSMSEEASESEECCGYELEFSEGEVHTSPMQTVLAVFAQISANGKIQTETEIEFGEMDMPGDKDKATPASTPAGMASDPKQAELDKKARQYCKDNSLDYKDSKSYVKAIKAVS